MSLPLYPVQRYNLKSQNWAVGGFAFILIIKVILANY